MKSKITGGGTQLAFTARVLGKYDVKYYRCNDTGFIQTEEPFWLDEAYSSVITTLDIGLVSRNLRLSVIASHIIERWFDRSGRFIDYGGGYGMFTRLMRDRGFEFFRDDPLCPNLMSGHFDWQDHARPNEQAELLTAWEVCEHLVDPLASFEKMFAFSDSLLFSTSIVPQPSPQKVEDWWYFTPATGQHIALYTVPALEHIAKKFSAQLHSDGQNTHLLTKRKDIRGVFPKRLLWLLRIGKSELRRQVVKHLVRDPSLLSQDLAWVERKIAGQPDGRSEGQDAVVGGGL